MEKQNEYLNGGKLNVLEAKEGILRNIINQPRIGFNGRLLGILFPEIGLSLGQERVFYIPDYKLKVSYPEADKQNASVEIVETPDDNWKLVPLNTPMYSEYPRATFHVIKGVLYLCFFRHFQEIKPDLSVELGEKFKSAIKIDIVNKKFECINHDFAIAPVDLMDAYGKMIGCGYHSTHVARIQSDVSHERSINKEFDEACEACCINDILNKKNIEDTLFLLNAYFVSPDIVTCIFADKDEHGYLILTGFVRACWFCGFFSPGDVIKMFGQLFEKGQTLREVLGITEEELEFLKRTAPRTRDKIALNWVRLIQKKKGLSFYKENY